jgi:hypothetical protein
MRLRAATAGYVAEHVPDEADGAVPVDWQQAPLLNMLPWTLNGARTPRDSEARTAVAAHHG